MADLNYVVLSGRVGGEPEIKEVGNTELATFPLANDRYAGPDKNPITQWVRVQIWGGRSKVAGYITKGMPVVVAGSLNLNTWEDDDGNKRVDVRIDADHIVLPPKGGSGDGEARSSSGRNFSKGGKKPVGIKKKAPF